jgi:four helix bundle protein
LKDFRDLIAWQKSHALVLSIYKGTANFPTHEVYGLRSQLRRAVVSIPSNIAEGCGRGGDCELGQFLQIAMGSACEVEYQLLLARDLEYLPSEEYGSMNEKVVEVKRILASLIQKVKA